MYIWQLGGSRRDHRELLVVVSDPLIHMILYYTILYYTILYYTILYYAIGAPDPNPRD